MNEVFALNLFEVSLPALLAALGLAVAAFALPWFVDLGGPPGGQAQAKPRRRRRTRRTQPGRGSG